MDPYLPRRGTKYFGAPIKCPSDTVFNLKKKTARNCFLVNFFDARRTWLVHSIVVFVHTTLWSFIVLRSRTAACAGDHRMRTHIVGWDGLLEWAASDIETYVLLPSASCTDHQVLVKHQLLWRIDLDEHICSKIKQSATANCRTTQPCT